MSTMYDKLGDLLNETLECGEVKFVHIDRKDDFEQNQTESDFSYEQQNNEEISETEYSSEWNTWKNEKTDFHRKARKTLYKTIPSECVQAYKLLGLGFTFDKNAVKQAYKEKLKYYHPDKWAGNEIYEKVATDKTREVVQAYNLLIGFIEK